MGEAIEVVDRTMQIDEELEHLFTSGAPVPVVLARILLSYGGYSNQATEQSTMMM